MSKNIFTPITDKLNISTAKDSEKRPLETNILQKIDVSFSTVKTDFANQIRSSFKLLSSNKSINLLDLGYLSDQKKVIDVDLKAIHINVGSELDVISKGVLSSLITNRIKYNRIDKTFVIGHQRHLTSINNDTNIDRYSNVSQGLSLGQIRHSVQAVEPILRHSQFIEFDTNAIRYSESGREDSLPTGLYTEEACQIMRYAGEAQSIKLYNINSGVTKARSNNAMTVALMIWYCLEGITNRLYETPAGTLENFDSYIVDIANSDITINFYKNKKSNKWWASLENSEVHIPCSFQEYKAAISGEISTFLTLFLQ